LKEKIYIVKIGGNIIDDEVALHHFLHIFSKLKATKILIHGGGKLATKLAASLNIPQQMVEGRRITDSETLKVVTMVYAGLINKSIVAALQSMHCNAIGMSGADGNLIRSSIRKKDGLDFGYVGDVEHVNTQLLRSIADQGMTAIISPITHNGEGQLLNTNADTIAQEIATSLASMYNVELVYSFEKKGVLLDVEDEASVIADLNPTSYATLRADGKIFAGMIPKLDNAFVAISAGVSKVIIGKAEELNDLVAGKTGTTLSHG
jgi:acetylglutamate kinase